MMVTPVEKRVLWMVLLLFLAMWLHGGNRHSEIEVSGLIDRAEVSYICPGGF